MWRASASAIVAIRATAMPAMPKVLPALDVSCLDSPASARMNSRAATTYAAVAVVSRVNMESVPVSSAAENMASMRRVTAKPPKTLMLASRIATVASAVMTTSPCPICSSAPTTMMPGDRVGHRHQRGVQRVVHVADHVVADHDRQREHRQVHLQRGR